jgi:type IV secretion system protein VirB9
MPTPPASPPFSPDQLNLRYRIEGDKPDWRPLAAFDDGRQVFIEMPEAMKTLEAPPLFVIGDEGPELANYRIAGRYYVIDRLFTKAEMKLGTGWGQRRVRIQRETPLSGGAHG